MAVRSEKNSGRCKTAIVYISVIGWIKITATDNGISGIEFIGRGKAVNTASGLLKRAIEEIRLYVDGKLRVFSVPVDLSGISGFTKLVLTAIREIPYGRTVSYAALASVLRRKNAARAVGNALGKNPVPIIIPCHRIIKSDGSIGGFSSGINIKKKLLSIEGKHRVGSTP